MSDYEATAYLSLEKLKVTRIGVINYIGETHVGVLTVLGEDKEGIEAEDEVFKGSD